MTKNKSVYSQFLFKRGYFDVGNNFMTKHIINIENKEIHFNFNEGANCWQSKIVIDGIEIEVEIDFLFHKEVLVDWSHFREFYSFISKDQKFENLIKSSNQLVYEVGKAFHKGNLENVLDYKMEFSNSIYYKGKTDGSFMKNGYAFSLIYNFLAKRDTGVYGDEYGLYLVDIENNIIVGARRVQL